MTSTTLTSKQNKSLAIEISKLPILLGLRPPSVTTGSDDLLITDYYSGRPNSFSTGPPDVSSDVLRDLNVKCTRLEYERHLRQKLLSTFMDFHAASAIETAEPAELVPFFDDVVESGESLFERITVLDRQISDVQKEVRKEIARLHHEYSSLATTVTVVLAPVPGHTIGNAELELVYRELFSHRAVTLSSHCPQQELRPLGNQYMGCISQPSAVSLRPQLFSLINATFLSLLGRIGTMWSSW